MAEKYLKIIQNGTTSYVPNNQANKNFWAKQNSLVSRSQAAHKETVTILEATDEEVAFMQHSDVGVIKMPGAKQSNDMAALLEMMNRLQKQNDDQASKIASLIDNQAKQAPNTGAALTKQLEPAVKDFDEDAGKEKSKPDPKPKEK